VFAALCVLVLGLTTSVFAQEANAVAAATTTAAGKLVFTFTVTIDDTTIPKGGVLVCTATATVEGYTQKVIGTVSAVIGKNTCTATMPYSWVLATESTDKISLTYAAEIDYGYEFTASNGTATDVQLASFDKVTGSLASISVPTVTSTSIAVSATI
jgi:hypothetical protein